LNEAVIHLHPSLICNLSCSHCYSSSSPHSRQALGVEPILSNLASLASQGYQVLSLSGGEPFLYQDLVRLVEGAHSTGLRVHVITNGTVRFPKQLKERPNFFDLVAVSLDGAPVRHDRIRKRDGAFGRAVGTLRQLRDLGYRTAVVSCVTRGSIPELPDLYEVCDREGVGLLALRPVVAVGRGHSLLASHEDEGLLPVDLLRLKLMAQVLDSATSTRVRADVAFAGDIRAAAKREYPFLNEPDRADLAANINPLVIREDSTFLPFVYGISDRFALGRMASDPAELVQSLQRHLPVVATLVRDALCSLPSRDEICVDWFGHMLRQSELSHVS
jgi:MoaA/NifB/PqqE/SkfB family radical SAM enzyme